MSDEPFEDQIDPDDESQLVPAVPAATLVVFHDHADSDRPRLLMVRRAETMAFAAGAAVFPGGRVDPDDLVLAARYGPALGLEDADAAARVAAIRETIEETGLAVGLSGGDLAMTAHVRAGLLADVPLSRLLDDVDAELDLAQLAPFSRWRPNFAHSRVFDTRFYLTRIDGPVPELSIVERENSHLFWADAQQALTMADAGEIAIIFPTRRNLERLALYRDYGDALESTRTYPAHRITPFVTVENGERFLCIRNDCGYPVTRESWTAVSRG